MFDTVQAKYQVKLYEEQFHQLKEQYKDQFTVKIIRKIDQETAEITFEAEIIGFKIPYIKYYSNSQILYFQLSIPKYTIGNNYKMVRMRNLDMFYFQLMEDFKKILEIDLNIKEIKVRGLDICYNLDISETGYSMAEWLKFFSQQEIPHKPSQTEYKRKKQLQSVVFRANAKSKDRITFYNKEAEMIDNKQPNSHQAKNILRVEIKTSRHERKKFSNKLVDLLSEDFFTYIMDKYKLNDMLEKIHDEDQQEIPYLWLVDQENYKVYQLEKIAGHIKITDDLQDVARTLYEPKTFKNRQQDLEAFNRMIKEKQENRPEKKRLQITL